MTVSTKGHLEYTSPAFLSSGVFVKAIIMASTDKHFRKCVPPCPRFLSLDDTHDMCINCLRVDHAHSVLKGADRADCEGSSMKKLHLRLSLFSRELEQASAPDGCAGPVP